MKPLAEYCRDAIVANIRELDSVGDLPYRMVRGPLLHVPDPDQLVRIETNCPQLRGDTSELWIRFLQRDCPDWSTPAGHVEPRDPKLYPNLYRKMFREAEAQRVRQERNLRRQLQSVESKRNHHTSIVDFEGGFDEGMFLRETELQAHVSNGTGSAGVFQCHPTARKHGLHPYIDKPLTRLPHHRTKLGKSHDQARAEREQQESARRAAEKRRKALLKEHDELRAAKRRQQRNARAMQATRREHGIVDPWEEIRRNQPEVRGLASISPSKPSAAVKPDTNSTPAPKTTTVRKCMTNFIAAMAPSEGKPASSKSNSTALAPPLARATEKASASSSEPASSPLSNSATAQPSPSLPMRKPATNSAPKTHRPEACLIPNKHGR